MDASPCVAELDLCHPASPFRAPGWRWGYAAFLIEHRLRAPRRHPDAWLLRALRYRRAAARLKGSSRLARIDPEVHAAVVLGHSGGPRLILELQARLLAGQTYADAAGRCNLDPAVVEAYEQVFYNVCDQLDARDWVVFSTMPDLHDDPSLETLVKAFALAGGPYVLDAVLAAVGFPAAPPGCEPTPEAVRWARLALETKKLTLSRADPVGVLRLAALAQEIGHPTAGGHTALCPPLGWSLGGLLPGPPFPAAGPLLAGLGGARSRSA
jgi:hypothetical protein